MLLSLAFLQLKKETIIYGIRIRNCLADQIWTETDRLTFNSKKLITFQKSDPNPVLSKYQFKKKIRL